MFSIIKSNPIFQMMFNPSYRLFQSSDDFWSYGSRSNFSTNMYINGEYLRSRTNNQYFCVVDKNIKLCDIHKYSGEFRKLDEVLNLSNYNPEKHNILRLEIMKNKKYFVEGYQAVYDENPDVTIMNMPLEELRQITPIFEPLPDE